MTTFSQARRFYWKLIPAALLAALAAGLAGRPAEAHSVFIFAWADGDRICTDSYFSKKNPVRGGTVRMLNTKRQELQTGLTNEQGMHCFSPPAEPADLVFVIEAGEGHRGEFRLAASDLEKGGILAAAPASLNSAPEPLDSAPDSLDTAAPLDSAPDSLDAAALRRLLREELQAQLSPIRKTLAENSAGRREAGWREIIGGLGWLAGLAGFALWLVGRGRWGHRPQTPPGAGGPWTP
jgi:nickel transport protein